MKKIKFVKFLSLTFLILMILLTGMPAHAAEPSNSFTASMLLNKTTWIYKEENGRLYRRLLDLTTGTWIGDWELVP